MAAPSHAQPDVTLVIPGRNCAGTIRECLSAVLPILDDPESRLKDITFVDDGSTDETTTIVQQIPRVRLLQQPNRGPGAARNNGWRNADTRFVWFIDSDCVAELDALQRLLPHMDDESVAGVSGSYGIVNKESLLARLVHEEIIQRHLAMPSEVNYLASFNVLYRKTALERVGGFDESFITAEDAQLSYQLVEAGFNLRFAFNSRVGHYHPTRLFKYLKTQARHGYWRVWLHMQHRGRAVRDSYSSWLDHLQPPLAMFILASLVFPMSALFWRSAAPVFAWFAWLPILLMFVLLAMQMPMMFRLLARVRRMEMLLYAPLGFIRAFWRGAGMSFGMIHYYTRRNRNSRSTEGVQSETAQ